MHEQAPEGARADPQSGVERLIAHVKTMAPVRTAVVHPCDALSLGGALDARDAGVITPVLVAPLAKLRAVAADTGLELGDSEVVDVPHSHAAAATAAIILMDFFSMMYSSLCSIIGTRFTYVHSSNPLQLR